MSQLKYFCTTEEQGPLFCRKINFKYTKIKENIDTQQT